MDIYIDFDGTIVHDAFPGIGAPILGAAEAIRELKRQGHTIHIFSTRANTKINPVHRTILLVNNIIEYMQDHDIPFDFITPEKPLYHLVIDDRAIGFRGDWESVLEQAKNFQAWEVK